LRFSPYDKRELPRPVAEKGPADDPPDRSPAAVIVDWGTTSFRADLVTGGGEVLDHVETPQGIAELPGCGFEQVLTAGARAVAAGARALPVVALGMITSRNGWVEVPYVPCPAGPSDLARGAVRRTLPDGAPLLLLPGLSDPARLPFPDVMRGEETQIVGNGLDRAATVVLPGTHSKWARVRDGRIQGFQTFVTGEIFAVLTKHAFIARAAVAPAAPDMAPSAGASSRPSGRRPCCRSSSPPARVYWPGSCAPRRSATTSPAS
jgi:2-dehydro-3-deoxygalactonokinase